MNAAGRDAFAARTSVSRETLDALQSYADLLLRWNSKINLVSGRTLKEVWTRHFLDSWQIAGLAKRKGHWIDLGSGGGFPGLVVAILLREDDEIRVTLVEADQRKAVFLRTVTRQLGLTASVIAERIEDLGPLNADILSARALAPLGDLLRFAERHMRPDGTAIFLKGEKAQQEIADALEHWRFDCEKHTSQTDANSTILCIGDIKRV